MKRELCLLRIQYKVEYASRSRWLSVFEWNSRSSNLGRKKLQANSLMILALIYIVIECSDLSCSFWQKYWSGHAKLQHQPFIDMSAPRFCCWCCSGLFLHKHSLGNCKYITFIYELHFKDIQNIGKWTCLITALLALRLQCISSLCRTPNLKSSTLMLISN